MNENSLFLSSSDSHFPCPCVVFECRSCFVCINVISKLPVTPISIIGSSSTWSGNSLLIASSRALKKRSYPQPPQNWTLSFTFPILDGILVDTLSALFVKYKLVGIRRSNEVLCFLRSDLCDVAKASKNRSNNDLIIIILSAGRRNLCGSCLWSDMEPTQYPRLTQWGVAKIVILAPLS